MKTKEFIKRVKELGYKVNKNGNEIVIMKYRFVVARTYTNKIYVVTCCGFVNIGLGSESKLFDLIFEYAKTPIDEREEEKQYYLKHKYFKNWDNVQYFTFDYIHKCAYVRSKLSTCKAMQQFTLKEIEEIKEKFNTDLSDFELVEVEE